MASTAGKMKEVLTALADLYERGPMGLVHNKMIDYSAMLQRKELVEIPEIGSLTTVATQTSGDDVTGISAQQASPTLLELKADQSRGIFVLEEDQRGEEYLGGNFYQGLTMQAVSQLMNYVDENISTYLVTNPAYDTSATYHDNVAGDSLAAGDFTQAKAALMSNDGMKNLALFMHPYGVSSLSSISGFIPNYQAAEAGVLGIPRVGSIYGIPIFESNSVPRSRTVSATASAIATNVWTITLPAGHGIVPGVKVTTSGGSVDITTATAVDSVTATTIVVTFTAGDNAANGALTVTVESCENIMADLNHCWFGFQRALPRVRYVDKDDSTSTVMQMWARWGRLARAGRVRVLHSPVNG